MAFRVLIRVDCSQSIGMGHAMRCLSLAHALRGSGCEVRFACAETLPAFTGRLSADGFDMTNMDVAPGTADDAQASDACAAHMDAGLIVMDGYNFRADFQGAVGAPGRRVMVVDDNAELAPYRADIILNQNPYADYSAYARQAAGATCLVGARYTMLRPEFAAYGEQARQPSDVSRLLVALGGTDATGITGQVISALEAVNETDLDVTVAMAAPNNAVDDTAGTARHHRYAFGPIADMAAAMADADAAVIGAGATLWEAAFMGLPSVALIVADNQAMAGEYFGAQRCGHVLDARGGLDDDQLVQALQTLIADPMRRRAYVENGHKIIDGGGAARVAEALLAPETQATDG